MTVVWALLGVIAVALGGALGALGRWGLAQLAEKHARPTSTVSIPWATFAANMIACFVIGLVTTWFASATGDLQKVVHLFLATGITGALSTMSSVALELTSLTRRGAVVIGLGYLLLTLGGGMVMLWFGVLIAA